MPMKHSPLDLQVDQNNPVHLRLPLDREPEGVGAGLSVQVSDVLLQGLMAVVLIDSRVINYIDCEGRCFGLDPLRLGRGLAILL